MLKLCNYVPKECVWNIDAIKVELETKKARTLFTWCKLCPTISISYTSPQFITIRVSISSNNEFYSHNAR